jgi:hypothetical protein
MALSIRISEIENYIRITGIENALMSGSDQMNDPNQTTRSPKAVISNDV